MNELPLADAWSEERAAAVAQRVHRRLEQRRRVKVALLSAAAVAAVVSAGALAVRGGEMPGAQVVRFADGSVATTGGSLATLVDRLDEVRVRLDQGHTELAVAKRPGRTFTVEVPPARIEVVGTRFTVRRDETRLEVFVVEGHVRVFVAGERSELLSGQFGHFSLLEPDLAAEPMDFAPPEAPPEAPPKSGTADWRPLARRGDFDRAWPLMKSVRDEPKDLLLASDVARLSGHPEHARGYLKRVIERHSKDPRAPLAAFTLGRVLLDELGWPRDAARAFAKARALDSDGPLAEDALAREVEAWSRAGETDRARAAAEAYLQQYPQGQRALGVRRYGGLQ